MIKDPDFFKQAEKQRKATEYISAIELYKKALKVYKKKADLQGVLDCLIALGDTLRAKGDFAKARAYYEEGQELAELLDDKTSAADAEVGLGLSLRALGLWKDALNKISSASRLYRSLHDEKGIAFALWAKAGTYRIKGDPVKAVDDYQKAYEIFKTLRVRSWRKLKGGLQV